MNLFSSSVFSTLRRIAIVFIAGLTLMITTACSPADTTASVDANTSVPEASEAAINRAQSNLSDKAIDEDVLSQQGESRARQTTSPVIAN
ncbi:MAG: hypothetical protein DCF25_11150 [Leptolyngbya foveolarum]|uniref:Uncharacterized protein n=1 Tax=Leptolyngbya foveolarum TaxID=47253 RepID=A0A2W4UB16_9CYAN|nr:MAG: hypothetical protein DCF25_11150 [Leptolyngbya foveolarum]